MEIAARRVHRASMATAVSAACLALPLLAPPAASALTQSATFDPVLQVDGNSASTGFTFSGFTGPVSSVTTTINLTKCDDPIATATGACLGTGDSYNSEIELSLQSPTGAIVSLVTIGDLSGQAPGGTVAWTFDDTASASLVGVSSLVSGTYLPLSSLSAFSGQNGNGTWNLLFRDDTPGAPLSINGWSLTVNAAAGPTPSDVPGPLPLFGLAAAFGWSRLLRKRIRARRDLRPGS